MKYEEYFKGKKITLMRIGLLGRGVGDAAFLAEAGAEVLVVDEASQEQMQASVDALKEYSNISFKFGPYELDDFSNCDMVLVGAGAPLDSIELEEARKHNVPLKQSAALFAELSGVPVIGVTGTRGKSSVTHMIHHVLSQGTEGGSVILGGNIQGVSNLQLLKEVKEDSMAVMELDSWQLQGFGWAGISPQIAIFTNFMEDHMDYYRKGGLSSEDGMKNYFNDKAQIFINQKDNAVLITSADVFKKAQELRGDVSLGQEVELVDDSSLPEDWTLKIPGVHNRMNAAFAYKALQATSLDDDLIKEGLESFDGVEGRLQFLKEDKGVKIYNDNNATTPAATVAGIAAVTSGDKDIVLIVGGTDKNIDLAQLVSSIRKHCKYVVLYSGTGTDKLKRLLPKNIDMEEHEMLTNCVKAAVAQTENGDVLLFSPAFSSFGKYYKNEYDRGDQFVAAIEDQVK